ncbi:ABC transporter permease [Microbacterium sp.]|uniref:ABC transporter permease n=1 Tax=Microbacterium sp. TaxID=51671 RepID=UPI003C70D5DF
MSTTRTLTARRTWLMPILLVAGLAAALPAVYLSATANPQGNVMDLPVALVVEAQDAVAGPPAAEQVAAAIEAGAGEAIAFTTMTSDELAEAMHEDRVAGAVVIPEGFDAAIASLYPGAAASVVPSVKIATNAGDGGLSNGLVTGNLTPVLRGVAEAFGAELINHASGALPPANVALLSAPFHVEVGPYEPLPDNSGLGTSAFYFALVLVLVAFIGASLVNPLVDSALGVIPSELGPLIARQPYTAVSRRQTFVAKAVILTAASPLAAAAALGVAAAFGVSASNELVLWLFATAVIAAIGTSALAVFAVLGPGIGALVNTLFFVAIAMVSFGGIVPLQAAPPFFRAVSEFSPFRHVVEGVRSLFYFDGNLAAGLGQAWISVAVGGAVGIALGLVVTTVYGRVKRFSRHPRPAAAVSR